MEAVGLAGLSNLQGDKELNILARQKYGHALQHMASAIKSPQNMDLDSSMRGVILLSIYEVIQASAGPSRSCITHLMGGAAILRNLLGLMPPDKLPPDIMRGFLQLCFSMLIPCVGTSTPLPGVFFEWAAVSLELSNPSDKPAAELLAIVARFVQFQVFVQSHAFIDGRPKTAEIIREALEIDRLLAAWEGRTDGKWIVSEERQDEGYFPADAVLDNYFHVYSDVWAARMWNHYRWSRILVCQRLLEFLEKYPVSSAETELLAVVIVSPTTSPASPVSSALPTAAVGTPSKPRSKRESIVNDTLRVSRDLLVSIPTHYRHPKLERHHRECLDKTKGGAGMGVAGVPTLLYQIRVAGCAPGIPNRCRVWAKNILETIWRDTGMLQAKREAEAFNKVVR